MRLRRALALILTVVVLTPIPTSLAADDTVVKNFALKYDLDSATTIYCSVAGPHVGVAKIQTTGSSTSVTETTVGSNPFAPLAEGDVLEVNQTPPSTPDLRYISTYTDDSNVVINPAADWTSGKTWKWYEQTCGTASTDGWMDVSGLVDFGITFEVQQIDATSVAFRIECRKQYPGAGTNVVYPGETSDCGPDGTLTAGYCVYTGVSAQTVHIPESEGSCRVGMKINTDDGADTTTHAEQITIGLVGRIRK